MVESIATITPSHHNKNEKLKELEVVFNEIISQLNNHYEFKVKTDEEALTNIRALVMYTSRALQAHEVRPRVHVQEI